MTVSPFSICRMNFVAELNTILRLRHPLLLVLFLGLLLISCKDSAGEDYTCEPEKAHQRFLNPTQGVWASRSVVVIDDTLPVEIEHNRRWPVLTTGYEQLAVTHSPLDSEQYAELFSLYCKVNLSFDDKFGCSMRFGCYEDGEEVFTQVDCSNYDYSEQDMTYEGIDIFPYIDNEEIQIENVCGYGDEGRYVEFTIDKLPGLKFYMSPIIGATLKQTIYGE